MLRFVGDMWSSDPVLKSAVQAIETAIASSGSVGDRAKLWEASERLLAEETDPVHQDAGAALYSAILSKGWDLRRAEISGALAGTRTNRLLDLYRDAAADRAQDE